MSITTALLTGEPEPGANFMFPVIPLNSLRVESFAQTSPGRLEAARFTLSNSIRNES